MTTGTNPVGPRDEVRATPVGGWDDPRQIEWYLGRIGTLEPRLAGEKVLGQLLAPAPRSVLDLGCGDGRLTSVVMAARPTIDRAVAVDRSAPMLDLARRRFAGDQGVEVRTGDLTTDIRPLGSFDLIVSGFAIHHLEDARKQALFCEVAEQLRPGGLFANLEIVQSGSPELHAEFLAAIGRTADDAEDRLSPIDRQLDWMRRAGLADVGCPWRWLGMALLVGWAVP